MNTLQTPMRRTAVLLMLCVASAFAVAQVPPAATQAANTVIGPRPTWMLGPAIAYGIVQAPPIGSSISGTPVRVNLGVDAVRNVGSAAALRLTTTFRLEQAEYRTVVAETDRPVIATSKLHVGEQTQEPDPIVISRHALGSFDIMLGGQFTVMPIDQSGSHVFAGIGGLFDYVVSATQTDDWTGVATLPAGYPRTYTYDLGTQAGIGGVAYLGAALSLGTANLVADVRYVARTPLGSDRAYTWLAGRGFRVGVGMWFPL